MNNTSIPERGNSIVRQELDNLTLNFMPKCSFILNFVCGILFISLIFPIRNSVQSYREYRIEYTNCKPTTSSNQTNSKECLINITIDEDLNSTVFVFYEIEDFYINHKDFAKSRDFDALDLNSNSQSSIKCEGAYFMNQIKDDGNYTSIGGNRLDPNALAIPCGLSAKYVFNDTFKLFDFNVNTSSEVFINRTNIAYSQHKEMIFKNRPNKEMNQWIDIEDENFIVWMSTESNSNFMKPIGRIETNLFKKGVYQVKIMNSKYISYHIYYIYYIQFYISLLI